MSFLRPLETLLSLISSIGALTYGVDSADTVAIQCLGGRSLGKYFVFNNAVDLEARYRGMRRAFRKEYELFVPDRYRGAYRMPNLEPQDVAMLLEAASQKLQSTMQTPTNTPLQQPQSIQFLAHNYHFPMWRWSYKKYGLLATCLCGILALAPLPILSIARWSTGASPFFELIYLLIFTLISMYTGMLLDIKREITYIKVTKASAPAESRKSWLYLFTLAHGHIHQMTPDIALDDLASGYVRKHNDDLLIPVMVLRPTLEFEAASWWFLLSPLRIPLLSLSYYFGSDIQGQWLAAFGALAVAQAWLQGTFAKRFINYAIEKNIPWFRRVATHTYTDEFVGYRCILDT